MRCTGARELGSIRQPVAKLAPSLYVADGLPLTRAGARAQACVLPLRILLTFEMPARVRTLTDAFQKVAHTYKTKHTHCRAH